MASCNYLNRELNLPGGLFSDDSIKAFLTILEKIEHVGNPPFACDSSKHPNGFEKKVLFLSPETGERIRLHDWHYQPILADGNNGELRPHSHAWDFISVICVGELSVEEYVEDNGDIENNFSKYSYRPGTSTGQHALDFEKNVYLRLFKRAIYRAGDIYFCRSSDIHTVTAIRPRTRTLILAGRHKESSVPVYSKRQIPTGLKF
jgi:hypothetical protein